MSEFAVETSGGEPEVLHVSGEFDIASIDEFLAHSRRALTAAESVLVVDFDGVTFIDSTGLGALVRIQQEARRTGKGLELTHVRREVRRVLDLTGLSELFPEQTER